MRYGRLAIAYRLWSQAINANQPTASAMSLYRLALDGAKGSRVYPVVIARRPSCDYPGFSARYCRSLRSTLVGLRPVVRVVQWFQGEVQKARNFRSINTPDRW